MQHRVMSDHRRSLGVLDGPTGIVAVVGALLTHRGRGERLGQVSWGDPAWRHRPDGSLWWARRVTLELVDARDRSAAADLVLPWLLDDVALETAAEDGVDAGLAERVDLGDHDGCYAGRPLVPLTQAGRRAGLHLVERPQVSRIDDGDDGTPFRLEAEVWPVYGRRVVPGRVPAPCPGSEGGTAVSAVRAGLGCPSRRWVDDTTARHIAEDVGLEAGADLWAAVRAALEDPAGRAAVAGAPSHTVLRHFGDVLMDVVFSAVGPALRCGTREGIASTAHRLAGDVATALYRFVSGQGRFGALLVRENDTDTLARLEQRRTVTFLHGTHGLPGGMLGRTDLRQLHPDWSGRLCPLQTPESQDIGLIRFRAAGDLAADESSDWADLSLSAGLIPFVGHDDPARSAIGAKNLKQAVPLLSPEIPWVRTGMEAVVAEEAGVLRAPFRGRVHEVGADAVALAAGSRRQRLGFGPAWPYAGTSVADWTPRAAVGDVLRAGDLLATAPDVVVGDDGRPFLALGVNALVGLLSWHGLNYEDGVVVSASFAARMTSHHERTVDEDVDDDEWVVDLVEPGTAVDTTTPVAEVRGPRRAPRTVTLPEEGVFHGTSPVRGRAVRHVRYRVVRRLAVGDKVSNRHGGKGVVSRVAPDEEMPRTPDGRVLDALLNPLGVLRRLNMGQVLEMNAGLAAQLSGGGPVTAGRVLDDRAGLARQLSALGAPGGRLPLRMADGSQVGPAEGVIVGPQYLVKLDHMAFDKVSARADGPRSPRTAQPRQAPHWRGGRRTGSAQRLGEMELWALQAAGVTEVLHDALRVRGVSGEPPGPLAPTLLAVDAHLRVAGLHLSVRTSRGGSTSHLADVVPEDVLAIDVQRSFPAPVDAVLAPRSADGTPLRWLDADEQAAWGRWGARAARPDDGHPLHDDRHGTSDAERQQVRWVIPLAVPVSHPWQPPRGGTPLPPLGYLPVLPPAYRVAGADPLDRAYLKVCRLNARLLEVQRLAASGSAAEQATRLAQALEEAVVALVGRVDDGPETGTVAGRLGGKAGLLRRWLLGRATDRSGRAVIVPDPERDPQTLGVPRAVFDAIVDGRARDEHRDVVLLNRQPTLHPYGIQAFRAEPVDGHAVRLHPLVLGAIAGDHDGDTVALHWPVTPAARSAAWERLRPARHLVAAGTGSSLAKLDLDIAVGLLLGSADGRGRAALGEELGTPIDAPLTPEALRDLVHRHASCTPDGDADAAVDWLARLQRAGWERASGWGFSVADLPDLSMLSVQEDVAAAVETALAGAGADSPLGRIALAHRAGAAGGAAALAQLLVRRGRLPGPNPLLPAPDCPRSLLDGLPADQLMAAAAGGLGRLAEKKLITPVAGALTKTLAELAYDVAVSGQDCGTTTTPRSPLTCVSPHPCTACYGIDLETGAPVRSGRRVGLLAATVVGERGTQLAMKTFHGGGTRADVGADLIRLRALLGQGRSPDLAATTGHERLTDLMAALPAELSGAALHEALSPVLAAAERVLGGAVAQVHVAVLLRQLWETARDPAAGGGHLAQRAERRGRGPLELATLRGRLAQLLREPAVVPERDRPSARTSLVVGVAR